MTEQEKKETPEEQPQPETTEQTAESPAEPEATETQTETPTEEKTREPPETKQEPKEDSPDEDEYSALLKESETKIRDEPDTVGPAASTDEEEKPKEEKPKEEEVEQDTHIFALRTTANREDQVLAFVSANAARKKLPVYSVIGPHGMRGYIFVEAADRQSAEQAATGVPYAKGLLPSEVDYKEIEHMLEQVKKEINIQKNDIVEIISGPFKREQAKISRVDKTKEEVVVELLEAAVPIPITLKTDDVKVIRREDE